MESFFSERALLCAELQGLDARGAVLPQQPLSWGGRKKHQTGSLGLAFFPRHWRYCASRCRFGTVMIPIGDYIYKD